MLCECNIWFRHGEFIGDPCVDLLLLFNAILFLSLIIVAMETNVIVSSYLLGNVKAQFGSCGDLVWKTHGTVN